MADQLITILLITAENLEAISVDMRILTDTNFPRNVWALPVVSSSTTASRVDSDAAANIS